MVERQDELLAQHALCIFAPRCLLSVFMFFVILCLVFFSCEVFRLWNVRTLLSEGKCAIAVVEVTSMPGYR